MEELLRITDLKKHFKAKTGFFGRQGAKVRAVDGISFSLRSGETMGLVGESGCGKSTTGRLILRLIEPSEGKIEFEGQDITEMTKGKLRALRKQMQIIFQDPFASLNPRMTVQQIISQGLRTHNLCKAGTEEESIITILEKVGLEADYKNRYPHEFSGGQRQRIGIARALVLSPKLIVADEPVSSLDVSIQAQIINLMKDLQEEFGLSYLFIAHDLSVVEHVSNRVAVMYLGKIVELATDYEIYNHPQHPYTQALLSAVPLLDPTIRKEDRIILKGDVPSPISPPKGCRFNTRCWQTRAECKTIEPEFKDIGNEHLVACHLR